MKTDEAMVAMCEAMRTDCGAGPDFEVELGELIGRYRAAWERRQRDAEAARLLPYGWREVAERFGVCKATVYNMADRARQSNRDQAA